MMMAEHLFSKTFISQRQKDCDSNNRRPKTNSATPPPTDRASERNKKREITFRLSLVKLREEDSNLRPPGYEPGKLTSCSTPRCIFTFDEVSRVLLVQRYGKKTKLPNLFLKYFKIYAKTPILHYSNPTLFF